MQRVYGTSTQIPNTHGRFCVQPQALAVWVIIPCLIYNLLDHHDDSAVRNHDPAPPLKGAPASRALLGLSLRLSHFSTLDGSSVRAVHRFPLRTIAAARDLSNDPDPDSFQDQARPNPASYRSTLCFSVSTMHLHSNLVRQPCAYL